MADTINIGNYEVSSFKVGSGDCKIYLGDTLLYPKSTYTYKLLANYNDSTEYKVECDGGTALTASEVSGHATPKSAMTSADVGICQGFSRIDTNAFYGCSGLTSITIDNSIKSFGNQAFMGCSGLTSFTFPTGLKRIEGSCFRLCNKIKTINVPNGVENLSSGCFADMTGLSAATIPATVTGSSTNVFLRDSSLNNVHFLGRTAPPLNYNSFKDTGIQKIYIPDCDCYDSYTSTTGFRGYETIIYPEGSNTPCNTGNTYLTFTATESGTFKFSGNSISYSLNSGSTWTTLASDTNSPTVSAGSKIMWKATGLNPTTDGIGRFSSTGSFTVEGNAMSLLFGDNYVAKFSFSGKNFAFRNLFSGCTGITSAENLILPATTLSTYCYANMFKGCSNLEKAPKLPAAKMETYCYQGMFANCSKLKTSPELKVETLSTYCYQGMFSGCTSLTTAPVLSVLTLQNYCYSSMFAGCTSLTTAPVLPATSLTSNCYREMFSGCTKLNYIKAMFTTTPATTYTRNWVNGVASTGTFVKNSAATWNVTGNYGVPTGWTIQTAS